jgi:type I restriction enzyme S subunit
LQIPLPPEAEQKRIADKLDTVLTRVDAVNTRLARVAPLLKRFRQSVLAAATSGRLTVDWRIAHAAADWLPRTVDSLCLHISDGPFGSNLKSDDYTEAGARVVRLENIGHLSFDATKQTFISIEKYETLRKHTLRQGDLLFSSFVDEEVRVCEFPADITEPTINKADCFCVRTDPEQVNRHFLAMRLACKSTYEELKDLVHGATRPRVNLRQLRNFEIKLPSPEEQTEIVRRVETLFAFADRLEARLQTAQTAANRLTPSLLAKAFRGELVSQDPNDEPASELLKRLAEQGPTNKTTRLVRKVKSK